MTLRYLIQKEFLQIRRNAFLPRLILLFPVVIMCVMPWVMNQEVKNIVVDVVDNDRTTLSQQLVHSIESSNYFIFNTWISSRSEFTPKTILTDDERADLVYAVKIGVKNNGTIKIGMYGEVKF